MCDALADVRFVPKADIASLIQSPVDAGEQRWWHSQVECLRRFEIDDHFVFCRYLHRHIARLLPFEDTIDIAGRVPVLVDVISPYDIRPPAVTR